MCCALLVMERVWDEFFKILGIAQWDVGPLELGTLALTG